MKVKSILWYYGTTTKQTFCLLSHRYYKVTLIQDIPHRNRASVPFFLVTLFFKSTFFIKITRS